MTSWKPGIHLELDLWEPLKRLWKAGGKIRDVMFYNKHNIPLAFLMYLFSFVYLVVSFHKVKTY